MGRRARAGRLRFAPRRGLRDARRHAGRRHGLHRPQLEVAAASRCRGRVDGRARHGPLRAALPVRAGRAGRVPGGRGDHRRGRAEDVHQQRRPHRGGRIGSPAGADPRAGGVHQRPGHAVREDPRRGVLDGRYRRMGGQQRAAGDAGTHQRGILDGQARGDAGSVAGGNGQQPGDLRELRRGLPGRASELARCTGIRGEAERDGGRGALPAANRGRVGVRRQSRHRDGYICREPDHAGKIRRAAAGRHRVVRRQQRGRLRRRLGLLGVSRQEAIPLESLRAASGRPESVQSVRPARHAGEPVGVGAGLGWRLSRWVRDRSCRSRVGHGPSGPRRGLV